MEAVFHGSVGIMDRAAYVIVVPNARSHAHLKAVAGTPMVSCYKGDM
jgi:hypothetical protein